MDSTKKAYCDATMPGDEAVKLRELCYRAPAAVPVEEAVEIMKVALGLTDEKSEGYNAFCPSALRQLPRGSAVTLARDVSVCIFVKPPKGKRIGVATASKMKADEIDPQSDGTYRMWWE